MSDEIIGKGTKILKHFEIKNGSTLSETLERDNKPYLDGSISDSARKYHPYIFLPPSEIIILLERLIFLHLCLGIHQKDLLKGSLK